MLVVHFRIPQSFCSPGHPMPAVAKTPRRRSPVVSRHYGGVSPEERRQQRRAKLMAAGLQVFGTRGAQRSTIRDICVEAGLTERYFYESFKSLGELFDAVYTQVNDELMHAVMAAVSRMQPEAMPLIETGLTVFFSTMRDDPRRAQILLIDGNSGTYAQQRKAGEAARGYSKLMLDFATVLYPGAKEQGLDTDILVTGLTGMTIHIATSWYRDGFKTPLETVLHNNLFAYRSITDWVQKASGAGDPSGRKPAAKKAAGRS